MGDLKKTRTLFSKTCSARFGSCLEHGAAHTADHARWSRRDFLSGMGLMAAGGALVLGGTPVRVFGRSRLVEQLRHLETDRILVLVQLSGGNDGLNTVIPVDDAVYYNARPEIAIPANQTLSLTDGLGLHPSFDALTPVYGDGQMAVLQNVGYPHPVLSHFAGTDIWLSANPSEETPASGWLGRYLAQEYPDFEEEPPETPLAVQMGGLSSMLFQSNGTNMGMSLASPELFQRFATQGFIYDVTNLPATTYGTEMGFVRSVANDSFQYASAILDALEMGANHGEYPNGNPLADELAIVAQLIKGRLGARIYHVTLGGFDTHAGQGGPTGRHANLLRNLSEAVKAFLDDLAADGWTDDVLVMTFSEFGRRVAQNGSGGTDHGTAAPMFLFGGGLNGGVYGSIPDLSDLDAAGNLTFELDFRSAYATVLQDWFGLEPSLSEAVLGDAFETINFVSDPATPTALDREPVPQGFTLHQNYPNPFNPATTITYTLARPARVTLRVYDVQGRLVQTLVDGTQPAGAHALSFNAGHLPSGTYLYRLQTPEGVRSKTMTLLR